MSEFGSQRLEVEARQVRAAVFARRVIGIPALLARGLIKLYRYTLSSVMGRTCRHLPTCSEYADIAIGRFGLWRGGWMALARFSRCRPLGTHGFDPGAGNLACGYALVRALALGRWSGSGAGRATAEAPAGG